MVISNKKIREKKGAVNVIMGTVNIRLCNDNDTNRIVQLLKKNKFYIGKFKPDFDETYYREIQNKRGMLFSALAEVGEDIICFIAVYKMGCQRVAKRNEVFISSFIIDKKYRNSFYKIFDLLFLVIAEIFKKGFSIITSEVTYDNYLSIHLLKKMGFVLLNKKPDLYNNLVLHNYVCGLIRFLGITHINKREELKKLLPYIRKKDMLQLNNTESPNLIWQTYNLNSVRINILFFTLDGSAVGFEIDHLIKIVPHKNFAQKLDISNYSNTDQNIKVFCDNQAYVMTVAAHNSLELNLSKKYQTIQIGFQDYIFNLNIPDFVNDATQESIMKINDGFNIHITKGILNIDGKLREVWPSIIAPYSTAGITPKSLQIYNFSKFNKNHIRIEEFTDKAILRRDYLYKGNAISIYTSYKLLTDSIIEPFYLIVLDDLSYCCRFSTKKGNIYSSIYDCNDRDSYSEEIIFKNFKKCDINTKQIESVNICYKNTEYNINFSKNTEIFQNCNCIIALQKVQSDYNCVQDNYINLGEIHIKKIVKESHHVSSQ